MTATSLDSRSAPIAPCPTGWPRWPASPRGTPRSGAPRPPAAATRLLQALAAAGYCVDDVPTDGNALMAELADGLTYDLDRLTPAQLNCAVGELATDDYVRWYVTLP